MDIWWPYRYRSSGYLYDQPGRLFPNLIIADGRRLNPQFLIQNNISHVINCAHPLASPSWFRERFPNNYECIGAVDSPDRNILEWYPKFEGTVDKFLSTPGVQNIFVHCECGINRAPILSTIYASKKLQKPFMDVANHLVQQRPCIYTNPAYIDQSVEYIKSLLINNEQLGGQSTMD